jgi:arginase
MDVRVILVPYDCGHYRKRMGLGPEQLFENGLNALLSKMEVNFDREEVTLDSAHPAEISAAFELARKVAQKVRASRAEGVFPIVLSGNCNAALGTVAGCGANKTAIVWFDAHGEATTPESTASGFLDGMPISTILGRAWQTLGRSVPGFVPVAGERIVLFGARQIEKSECDLLDEAGVKRVSTAEELTHCLAGLVKQVDQIYVHLDLDVLDSREATWNQWTSPEGISLLTLLEAITEIRKQGKVCALGVASYDPAMDPNWSGLLAGVLTIQTLLEHL